MTPRPGLPSEFLEDEPIDRPDDDHQSDQDDGNVVEPDCSSARDIPQKIGQADRRVVSADITAVAGLRRGGLRRIRLFIRDDHYIVKQWPPETACEAAVFSRYNSLRSKRAKDDAPQSNPPGKCQRRPSANHLVAQAGPFAPTNPHPAWEQNLPSAARPRLPFERSLRLLYRWRPPQLRQLVIRECEVDPLAQTRREQIDQRPAHERKSVITRPQHQVAARPHPVHDRQLLRIGQRRDRTEAGVDEVRLVQHQYAQAVKPHRRFRHPPRFRYPTAREGTRFCSVVKSVGRPLTPTST